MSRAQHDYETLRREYVSTDISIRELCKTHEIASWSTVNAKKKTEDWDGLRAAFKAKLADGEVATMVQKRIQTMSDIHEELLLAIRAGVRRYINAVNDTDNPQDVTARDLMGLIDKFLLLSGSTPHRTESRSLDAHSISLDGVLADAPAGLLRELADLAGDRGTRAVSVGRGPLVVLEGTG